MDAQGVRHLVERDGIAVLRHLYSDETIAGWNRILDPIFRAREGEGRVQIEATQLLELGVLEEAVHEPLQELIMCLEPRAVISQCYAIEDEAQKEVPSVSANVLGGWHRDFGSSPRGSAGAVPAFTIHIYLSDVLDRENGCFEIARCVTELPPEFDAYSVTGEAGLTFVWQRRYWHRAHPNPSTRRRRALKFSVQTVDFENPWLEKRDEYRRVQAAAGNPFVRALFAGYFDGNVSEFPVTATGSEFQCVGLPIPFHVTFSKQQLRAGRKADGNLQQQPFMQAFLTPRGSR